MKYKYKGKYIAVVDDNGWEYVTRVKGAKGAVTIVAITENDEFIFVKQPRVPLGKHKAIEWCAGLVGDIEDGEMPMVSAIRELMEETGYAPRSIKQMNPGYSSPGLTDEYTDYFIAEGCYKIGDGGGDETESIETVLVPTMDVHYWLDEQSKKGTFISSTVYGGLYFWLAE